ncbi:MAG TPA: NUDIX domain-containing protein [Gemmataceae bacterium]|nr:NUDIX domain-containing protein [Gemmataceae bacterium]
MSEQKFTYDYPHPAVAVDIGLFTVAGQLQELRLQVLLIARNETPYRGQWALPGGFVRIDEDLPDAALRELAEETGVREVYLEQVAAVGTPDRDTRERVITVVYVGLVAGDRHELHPTGDAREARWFDVAALPPLAFDHAELLRMALEHLRRRIGEAPLLSELLPETFTLSELQALTEAILGRPLDRRNFRRKVADLGIVRPAEGARRRGAHRPAQLYRFVPEAFTCRRERALPF